MQDILPVLKALADEMRLSIVHLLLTYDLCVGAIADSLGISKAAVSQHLKILRRAGLVTGEKRGYWTHYSIDKTAIYKVADALKNNADQAPANRVACHRSEPNSVAQFKQERREFPMCRNSCKQPIQLIGKPEKCIPEQIRQCHGDEKEHPCVPKKEKE